jgi:hypothetical protein
MQARRTGEVCYQFGSLPNRCIGETLMEIRTVNNLPSAAAHDDAVWCLLAIELS